MRVHYFRKPLVLSVIFAVVGTACGSTRGLGGARSVAMRETMRVIAAGRVSRASVGERWVDEEVARFAIDRGPVSVRDFADAVREGLTFGGEAEAEAGIDPGLVRAHAWSGGEAPSRYRAHPMVAVSWPEARAFCAWRGARLPTAAEWERAVYGDDRRAFPWGEVHDPTRTNAREHGAGDTVPVLTHPRGAGPFEVADGVGQVAEWTETTVGEGLRVVMGSSWLEPLRARRPRAPEVRREGTRSLTLGFRCVRDVGG